ncbi:HYR domain-containing protein [Streptomyces sp. NPDC102462]|uniref:HYR domain-containing protein n=1 Tax=Streptomyces sp. NPDC102462 TaxID=3366178 RepID=UPI00382887F5
MASVRGFVHGVRGALRPARGVRRHGLPGPAAVARPPVFTVGVLTTVLLLVVVAAVTGVTGVAGGAPAAVPGSAVTPAVVDEPLAPGDSLTVDKEVSTPVVPPRPDIVLLVDGTGSMDTTIEGVQADLGTITDRVRQEQPDSRFAVATYGDQQVDGDRVFTVLQQLTDDLTAVRAGVERLDATRGGYSPGPAEDWINALWQIGNGAAGGFRENASPVVVLVGDASSHDPSMGHTLTDAVNALQNVGARVIAVDVETVLGDGLNGNGDNGNGPDENREPTHEPDQATGVVEATGGRLFQDIDPGQVADTIAAGLTNLPTTVSHQTIGCDPALTVALSPAVRQVTSGQVAAFKESITVADDAPQGMTLSCTVQFLLDGKAPGGDPPLDVPPARAFDSRRVSPGDALDGPVGPGTSASGSGSAPGGDASASETVVGTAGGTDGGGSGGVVGGTVGAVTGGSDGSDGAHDCDGGAVAGSVIGGIGGLGSDGGGLIGGLLGGLIGGSGGCGDGASDGSGGETNGGSSVSGSPEGGSSVGGSPGGGAAGGGSAAGAVGGAVTGTVGGAGDGGTGGATAGAGGSQDGGQGDGGRQNGGGDSGSDGSDDRGDGRDGAGRVGGAAVPEDYQQHITITVEDVTAPVVTVVDRTVQATDGDGTVIDFTATAEDTVDGTLPVTCDPASGSLFPVGTTRVTCTATDSSGNTGTGTAAFTVTAAPVPNEADIAVRAVVTPATAYTGLTTRADFVLTNTGPRPARNVVLTTAWPQGDRAGDRTLSALSDCTRARPCTIAPGSRVTVTQTAVYDTALRGEVRASVTGSPRDPRRADNTATAPLRVLRPKLTVTPAVARPGDVVLARGEDFPPGRTVALTWSRGITAAQSPVRVGRDGTFEAQVPVLRKDQLGPRVLRARVPALERLHRPEEDVLIVRRSLQPPDFAGRR